MPALTDFVYITLRNKILSNSRLYNKIGEINANLHKMLSPEDNEYIKNSYPNLKYNAAIYCLIHNIKSVPVCIECRSPVSMFYGKDRGFSKFCSIKCSRKNDISKNKRIETNLKKYGVQNPRQNANVIQKSKTNNLIKYGVACTSQLDEVKAKISMSLKATYATKHTEIIQKKNETFDKKYGMHPNLTDQIQDKKRNNTLEKYGVEYTTQLESTKIKSKHTLTHKYGVDHFSKTNESKDLLRMRNQRLSAESNNYFLEKISNIDTTQLTRQEISVLTDIPFSTVCVKLRELSIPVKEPSQDKISSIEIEIYEYIQSLGIKNIILNDRKTLSGKELDILLPENKLAIEVDGVYWHSEKFGKDKNYHLLKTIECKKIGIQLLHVFDTEWTDPVKQHVWKGMIKSRLGLNTKLYARKCILRHLSISEATDFCKNNHLQGYKGGSVRLGLYLGNILVQVIILGKPRYNKNYDYELIRAATLAGYTVVGGLSKLLSTINGSIISYADMRYSTGAGYNAIGMIELPKAEPNYFYVMHGKLESRLKYQKHKLKNILETFDNSKSESYNMLSNGYYRIWDCGNLVFTTKEK